MPAGIKITSDIFVQLSYLGSNFNYEQLRNTTFKPLQVEYIINAFFYLFRVHAIKRTGRPCYLQSFYVQFRSLEYTTIW